jgi:hypothetical protein
VTSQPLLVIGLSDQATAEQALSIRDQIRENHPDIGVLVIAGCTSIAVVESGED